MKKKLSFLMVALVALAAFATTMSLTKAKRTATEKSYTITFKEWVGHTDGDNNAQVATLEDLIAEGADYVESFESANVYQAREGRGIKFGTSSKTGSLSLKLKNAVKPTKIVVSVRGYSSSEKTFKLFDTEYDDLTTTFADKTASFDGNTEVSTITFGTVTKRCYVKSVTVYYQEESSEPQPAGPTTLINYPTSQDGITIGGTCEISTVKIHNNTDAVAGIKFANGYTTSGTVNDNKAKLTVEGGFKAGDVITIAGAFNNSDDTKTSAIDIFTMDGEGNPTVLFTTKQFINGRNVADDPVAEEFTLTADADELYLGRNGNTGTFVTLLTVTRAASGGDEPQPAEGEIVIAPASGDIYAALAEATEGKEVKSITINLTKDVTYTVSATLVTPGDFTINGNGATIDASALEAALITTPSGDLAEWLTANFAVKDLAVKGLHKSFFASAGKNYLYKDFLIDNCVIEITATSGFEFDFRKGGVAENFTINNSTIYAPTATANSLYTSQSAQKATEAPDVTMQTFAFTNSTLYNLAKGKNFFTHRQNSQKWLTFIAKNSIFVNCGKSGQAIKGMNGGGSSANPTWDIVGNIFNFDGKDTSAAESTGDEEEPVKNSFAGVVNFTDAATGNLNGSIVAVALPDPQIGDTRWTYTLTLPYSTLAELNALGDGDQFGYTGEALIVAQGTTKNGDVTTGYTYIKDDSGSALLVDEKNDKVPADAVGKTIKKDWVGTVKVYRSAKELIPADALEVSEGVQEVKYPFASFEDITAEHANEVVCLTGVTYQLVNNEDITITTMDGSASITAFNKFAVNPGFATKDVEYNIIGAIDVDNDAVRFIPVAFVEKPTVDITVYPEDGTDISAAIDEASKGHFVRNITLNLAAVDGGSANYTLSKSIEAAGNLIINGNGAVIDASALETPFVLMSATPRVDPVKVGDNDVFVVDHVTFQNVTITGLKYQLFYANKVRYLVRSLLVDNSVIAIDGTAKKTIFDFNGRGNAEELIVKNSTLWAEPSNAQNGGLYSSQSGDGAMDLGGTKQVLSIQNSTLYNIASGKTTCSQRRNDVTGMEFVLKNNVIVNCGKVGEFVAGLDGGSYKSKPTWEIENNAFNVVKYNEDGTFTSEDVSAKEDNKMGHEVVKNSYVGSVYFKDVTNGDFAIDAASAAALGNAGDTRWGTYEVAHYNIAVSEDALQYADIAVQATAIEDEIVKVTVTEKNGFKLKELIAKVGTQTTLKVTDNSFIMPPANVGIDAAFDVIAADYELAPAAGTDIAAALDGKIIRNLKLTLAEGGAYTLTKSIELGGNLEIIGNGATIDASALAAPFVSLSATPQVTPTVDSKTDEATGETTETILAYPLDKIAINGVIVKGLSQQLVKSNNLYLVKDLTLENSIVEVKGAVKKSLFDFSSQTGGNVINLTVDKSTLYADATTQWQNGGFFTSQSSKKLNQMGVDVEAEGFTATTTITNSTLYSFTNGKTVSTLIQNSQSWMRYVVKNNVIVDCGKKGQFLKGLNAGQAGKDDNWDVDTNLFNFAADEVAEQQIGSTVENIKNSVHAVVTFADAAAGDFNMSIFKDPRIAELPAIGDPRWTVTGVTSGYAINVDAMENGTVTPSKTWSAADETIKLTVTPAEGYELETLVAKIGGTEIEIAEDKSFIMPATDVTVTATFVAVPKLFIIGDMNSWDRTALTEMKYNLETQTYEYEFAPDAFTSFAFATKQFTAEEAAADADWSNFNTNYRYAIGEGDVEATLNEALALKKIAGTLQVKAVKEGTTYKITVAKDLSTVTIAGEAAPEPVGVDKLFIMGTGTPKGWDGTTEMTFNEATQAFEYIATVTEDTYLTFGDAEWTSWADFNGKHRFAPAEGNTEAVLDQVVPLVLVNDGNVLLKTPGTYKLSVTKDLKLTVTAEATGINTLAVDKLDNAVIFNLQGVRIDKSQAKGGVFIVNGKKTFIK